MLVAALAWALALASLGVYMFWPVLAPPLVMLLALHGPAPVANAIAAQLRQPSGGLLGRAVGEFLARKNLPSVYLALDAVAGEPGDRVLELGFGPGVALAELARTVLSRPEGLLAGADPSPEMVEAASARNRAAVDAGRMQLHRTTAERLGAVFEPATFNKAFAVHCLYFWDRPLEGLAQVLRVLRPGGFFVVVGARAAEMKDSSLAASGRFTFYDEAEVTALLLEAGFATAEHRTVVEGGRTHMVVVGRKAAAE